MNNLLKNKAIKIIGFIVLLFFLPFIPIGLLMYKSYKKLSGRIRIAALSVLGISLFFSFIWSWVITSPSKSTDTSSKNLELVENSSPAPSQSPRTAPNNPNIQLFKVTKVIDGDTIEIEGGKVVRYIGIDTPESVDPRKPVQCFAKEATAKNKELVEGGTVGLEKDVSETDKYGRLLRYVYTGDLFINQVLVNEGYAYASSYPPDIKYQDKFNEGERKAREGNKGLWLACSASSPTPKPSSTVTPKIESTNAPQPQNTSIQNTSGSFSCGSKRYCTQMASCEEAYFYLNNCGLNRLDGDSDGVPCESLCR